MAEERRDTLLDVIEKVKILSEEPNLVERAERVKSVHGKGIHPDKRADYFRILMGFLIDADKSKMDGKLPTKTSTYRLPPDCYVWQAFSEIPNCG